MPITVTSDAVAAIFHEEAGRLTAALVKRLGDFDLAEECVQDALVAALEHWPRSGIPQNPGAWLMTTARRKGIDRLRREKRYREKVAQLEETPMTHAGSLPDERLELIFTCCHPALAREAQLALTLRSVAGLTTAGDRARVPAGPRRRSRSASCARSGRSSTRRSRSACRRRTSCRTGSERCSPSSTSCSTRATSPPARAASRTATSRPRRSG